MHSIVPLLALALAVFTGARGYADNRRAGCVSALTIKTFDVSLDRSLIRPFHGDIAAPTVNESMGADYDSMLEQVMRKLASQGMLARDPELVLEGYDFYATTGYIIDDSGWLASYREIPGNGSTRRLVWDSNGTGIQRDVPESEIAEVRARAREAVIQSYEDKIQPSIIEAVDRVESRLDPKLLSFGVVRDRAGKIVGAVRVTQVTTVGGRVVCPALEVMRERGLLSDADEQRISAAFKGHRGEEIGQFYIDKNLSAEQRDATRNKLLIWLAARNAGLNTPTTLELVHTSRPAHDRLWSTTYGIDLPLIESTAGRIVENLKYTTANHLYAKLKEALGIL